MFLIKVAFIWLFISVLFGLVSLLIAVDYKSVINIYWTLRIYKLKVGAIIFTVCYKLLLTFTIQYIYIVKIFLLITDIVLTVYSFICVFIIMEFKYFIFASP